MAADDHAEIASLKKRLAELDEEREGLLASLEQLQRRNNAEAKLSSSPRALNAASAATAFSNAEKVMLFRSFFRVATMSFPSGGKIQNQARSATHLHAITNGCAASARSRGSSAVIV